MKKYTTFLFFLFCISLSTLVYSQSKTSTLKEDTIPILAWFSIPDSATSVERYQELKDAGFSHSFTFFDNADQVEKALNTAEKVGVKIVIMCPELASKPEETVRRFMKHPALGGYFLRDEPSVPDFKELGKWAKRIQAVDKHHMCYLNLFPTYAEPGGYKAKNYTEYVQKYIKEVPTQIISFDHYPVVEDAEGPRLRKDFYENLQVIADESKKANKPFWAFAMAVAHTPYPVPTLAQLRLQMFSNLAYGAQGLQYFTFWTPGQNPNWNFHHGPIGLDGKRTDVYDRVKAMNTELKALMPYFSGAKLVAVKHYAVLNSFQSTKLPTGVSTLKWDGASNASFFTSEFIKGENRYLALINKDFQNPLKIEISFQKDVKKVLKDGTTVNAELYSNEVIVDAGDMILYELD